MLLNAPSSLRQLITHVDDLRESVNMFYKPENDPEEFWSRNQKPTSKRKLAKTAELYELDLRSVTALFNAHVDFDKPKNYPMIQRLFVPPSEVAYLIETEVIPASESYTANDVIDWLLKEKKRCDRKALANAFIVGVANGRYDYLSALGSYANFYAVNGRNRAATIKRGIYGLPKPDTTEELDFVYDAYRRINAPYVFHYLADYAAFDLSRFNQMEIAEPTSAQCENFHNLLNAVRELPRDAKLTELQKCGTGIIKGNKHDRQNVFEILGYCDILGNPEFEPMRKRYVHQEDRPWPSHFYAKEWRFPTCFWDGQVGVNEEAVAFWFPGYEA